MQLHHGDCLEIMPELDRKFDAIVADLPYGTTACKWDTIIPLEPLWEGYKRLIKDNGAVVLFGSQPFTSALVMSNPDWFRYEWIWQKDKPANFALANRQPMKYHENILVFGGTVYNKQVTSGHKPMNAQASYGRTCHGSVADMAIKNKRYGGKTTRNPSSILSFNTVKHNTRDKGGYHPTQKPIALMEYLIFTYTNKGDWVLDNVMGSGTTGVACVRTGRNFVGIEKNHEYFEIAERRIQTAQPALL